MKENSNLSQNIKLPELGEGVTEGELIKWLVSKGDSIKTDQPVAEVMTDKAAMEVPSPLDGVVESFSAQEGDTVQVGQILLTIKGAPRGASAGPGNNDSRGASTGPGNNNSRGAGEQNLRGTQDKSPQGAEDKSLHGAGEPTNTTEDSSVLATPFTRRLARELGVSLSQIQGSGLAGRITKEDILNSRVARDKALRGAGDKSLHGAGDKSLRGVGDKVGVSLKQNPPSARTQGFSIPKEAQQKRIPLKGIRKKIAEKMQNSKTVIPHFTLLESADVEQLDKVKNAVKDMLNQPDSKKIKVTYLSFVMKCLLQTIKEFPELNASIDDFSNEVVIKNYYNFGFAVDTPRGLLVPVIKDLDKKSLMEVSFEIQTLAEKARAGNILPEEMSGGTITITNIGSLGGEYATPIINAPETAILGMYRIYVKPHWDGSAFVPKKTMNFSLTCDHRLIDGAVSARALKSFIHKVENPLTLFI